MVGHRHSHSGSEVVRKEYALLDGDLTNPVMHHIIQERDSNYLFHKHFGKVISGGFQRKHQLTGHSITEVLEKLFLNSELLCTNLIKDGYEAYDTAGTQYKLQTASEQASFMQASIARPVGENRWQRRYGMGKNFAPRFSPISWWVYVAEDQHIQYVPETGEIYVTLDTVCKDIGEHMRTIRLFTLKSTGPDSVEVSQFFGAINTRSGVVDHDAMSMRDQVFSELEDPNWKWANRATEILSK